jgi:hypothetical protein
MVKRKSTIRTMRDGNYTYRGVFPVWLLNRKMRDAISATTVVCLTVIIVALLVRYL